MSKKHSSLIVIIFIYKRKTHVLLYASKEIRVQVNTGETIYLLMYHHQNAGQNHNI
jgi:hypothetical protein